MLVKLGESHGFSKGMLKVSVILPDNADFELAVMKQAIRDGKQIALVVVDEVKPSDDILPVVSLIEDIMNRKCHRCNEGQQASRKELINE